MRKDDWRNIPITLKMPQKGRNSLNSLDAYLRKGKRPRKITLQATKRVLFSVWR